MPFKKGHTLSKGKGRKGFSIEKAELARLRKEFKRWHKILDDIEKGNYRNISLDHLKLYLDSYKAGLNKLHAEKKALEVSGNQDEPLKLVTEVNVKTKATSISKKGS